mmetsp:Transcript_2491/g.6513  ORF Transcript_2491/g.6513 Transcript_2491/m.6513 type:complete len:281 (-) Transcript_2491:175-1017(-)
MGAPLAGPHHQPVVGGAVEADCERIPRAADLFHQLDLRAVRGDGRGRGRGGARDRRGLAHRAEVPPRLRRVWWQLLPEGHPQPRVSLPLVWPARGRELLAAGDRDERLAEAALCYPDGGQDVQHRLRQEDRHPWLRVQEGHGRHTRDSCDCCVRRAATRGRDTLDLRPQGFSRADDDGPRQPASRQGPGRERPVHCVRGRARLRCAHRVGRVQDNRLQPSVRLDGQALLRLRRAQHPRPREAGEHRLRGLGHRQGPQGRGPRRLIGLIRALGGRADTPTN